MSAGDDEGVLGLNFAEELARAAMEQKFRHPLRDNKGHAALVTISDGDLLCRCHFPNGWRSTPDVLTHTLAALVCDEAFLFDEAPQGSVDGGLAVEVLWAAANGGTAHSVLPYRVEGGSADWGATRRTESTYPLSGTSGNALEAMSSGFGGQAVTLDRDLARKKVRRLGVDMMFIDEAAAMFDVDPGDPCPCGSGLRFAECHNA